MTAFQDALEDAFEDARVDVRSADGETYEGVVDAIEHDERHVLLRDAVAHDRGADVGAVMVAHADVIETVADESEAGDEADETAAYACDVDGCNYVTDTEHGIAIHQGRIHQDDDESEDEAEADGEDEDAQPVAVLDHTSTADLETAYREAGGNIKAASGRFDVGYSAIFRRMKEHGVHEPGATEPEDDGENESQDDEDDHGPEPADADRASADPNDIDEDEADGDGETVGFADYNASSANGRECQNCGAHLTRQFAKVFEPERESAPRACPNCTDLIREGDGTIREKRDGHRNRGEV